MLLITLHNIFEATVDNKIVDNILVVPIPNMYLNV